MSSLSGDVKINRLKAKNKSEEYRAEKKALVDTINGLSKYSKDKTGGFDPTRTYQYVANIDSSVWSAILETFARYDSDGNLIHDGLLYKPNPNGGAPVINRDFFYMLLQHLESCGYKCDMRSKIVV
jgi:hypothetical protein